MKKKPTRKRRAGAKVSVGYRIVRAWFDTVVNPLIRALQTEQVHLDKRDWTGPDKIAFWTNSINWLRLKGLDEQLVQLLTIHAEPKLRKPLVELGHVDVGLTQLARQLGATLITDDSGLFAFAPTQTVRCVHFRDLISESLET